MHQSELDYERFLFGPVNGTDVQDAADAYEDYRDDVDDVQDDPFFDDVPRVRTKRGAQRQDDAAGVAPQHHQQYLQQQRGSRGRVRGSSRAILLEQRGVTTTAATPVGSYSFFALIGFPDSHSNSSLSFSLNVKLTDGLPVPRSARGRR